MAAQPTGTVTMLFTDIEGSTRLLDRLGPERYRDVLDLHGRLLRHAFERYEGYEVDSEGDAFFVAFGSAQEAVAAAAEAQQALADAEWPEDGAIRVRMGLHTGEPVAAPPKYVGLDVHKAARIMAAGHGGQVLLSSTTCDLVQGQFPLRDLGEHRLKDLSAPQRLHQLGAGDFPPLKSLDSATNLPVQPTALIGRTPDLAAVLEMVRREGVRLLTITGTGGTGKTRFALQAAAELVDDFEHGVFFVNLAPITDSEFVLPTIAQTVGVREVEGQAVEETLVEHLRSRSVLLLLDNFEQVLEGAASIAALMVAAPHLSVLVTSRAPLRLTGEREYPLAPLAEGESVVLFIERAQAVQPSFALDDATTGIVAEICARLDGLPLAIELAAARVRLLPPEALLARLQERLRLLTGGARDLPKRQRTLRDTIEWSYQLLDAEARLLFDRLAVFVGGRSLEAIEEICNSDLDVFSALSTLVDNSLVRQEGGAEPRYVMLETIHEFAWERLAERGEGDEMRSRHLGYFRDLVERAAPQLRTAGQASALDRLTLEQGNIRAALDTALGTGDAESALAITGGCAYFWESQGRFFEAREWFARVLEHDDGAAPIPLASVLFWAGRLGLLQGELKHALALLRRAGEIAHEQGDVPLEALALGKAGWVLVEMGDGDAGVQTVERAVELAQGIDDDWVTGEVLNDLACATYRTDVDRARDAAEASLAIRRKLGDVVNVADSLNNLGYALALGGDPDGARPPLEESLDLARSLGDTRHVALAVGNLAIVSLLSGDHAQARTHFADAIRLSQDLGDARGSFEGLQGLAVLAALDGDHERAATITGAVDGLREARMQAPSPGERMMAERWLLPACEEAGQAAWQAAAARGRSLTLEAATALALQADPAGASRAP